MRLVKFWHKMRLLTPKDHIRLNTLPDLTLQRNAVQKARRQIFHKHNGGDRRVVDTLIDRVYIYPGDRVVF